YRPVPTKESMEKEIAEMDKALNPSQAEMDLVGMPVEYIEEMEKTHLDGMTKKEGEIRGKTGVIPAPRPLEDSTVVNIMNRHPSWKEMMVVTDVTGSMSPYLIQLVLWHNLNRNAHKVKRYVFFNDGDQLPDRKKKVGMTGGIYIHDNVKTG